jgi:hypothetical protein
MRVIASNSYGVKGGKPLDIRKGAASDVETCFSV